MKQCTNNRGRRLTRAEKIIVSGAGKTPTNFLYVGEIANFLILRDKVTGSLVYVQRPAP